MFDRCFSRNRVPLGSQAAEDFNHDVYMSSHNSGAVVRGNIFANASSHGLQARAGGIIEKEAPVPVSNVQILCPSCGPTRIGYELGEDGTAFVCSKRDPGPPR